MAAHFVPSSQNLPVSGHQTGLAGCSAVTLEYSLLRPVAGAVSHCAPGGRLGGIDGTMNNQADAFLKPADKLRIDA
jgi:hypothetical protein